MTGEEVNDCSCKWESLLLSSSFFLVCSGYLGQLRCVLILRAHASSNPKNESNTLGAMNRKWRRTAFADFRGFGPCLFGEIYIPRWFSMFTLLGGAQGIKPLINMYMPHRFTRILSRQIWFEWLLQYFTYFRNHQKMNSIRSCAVDMLWFSGTSPCYDVSMQFGSISTGLWQIWCVHVTNSAISTSPEMMQEKLSQKWCQKPFRKPFQLGLGIPGFKARRDLPPCSPSRGCGMATIFSTVTRFAQIKYRKVSILWCP